MTQVSRLTLSTIALSCLLSFASGPYALAQGLKTDSGNFGSGWQVGGAGGSTGSGDTAAGTGRTPESMPGAGGAGYGGYSNSGSSPGSSAGSYGGYGGYGGDTRPGAAGGEGSTRSQDPASAYQTPRSAGGGLRTQ